MLRVVVVVVAAGRAVAFVATSRAVVMLAKAMVISICLFMSEYGFRG
jgi:hypothetical protein